MRCKLATHLQRLVDRADWVLSTVAAHALAIVSDLQEDGPQGADMHYLQEILDALLKEVGAPLLEHLGGTAPRCTGCGICAELKAGLKADSA